jgi:ABC-type multidrug transport system ATPase subunit
MYHRRVEAEDPLCALEIRGLGVIRSGAPVLDDVTMTARAGEVLVVLGPNGAGKTTLLEAMVGVAPRQRGEVRLGGAPLRSFQEHASVFAYMPDDATLPEEPSVATLLGPAASAPVTRALDVVPLLARGGGELSRGEAKRVWLALTLSADRPVVVLDEPFGAFDPLKLDAIVEVVRGRARDGAVVVASVHQMTTAERVADRIVLLSAGRVIAQGSLDELRARAGRAGATLEEIFRALLKDEA